MVGKPMITAWAITGKSGVEIISDGCAISRRRHKSTILGQVNAVAEKDCSDIAQEVVICEPDGALTCARVAAYEA
jgi:hypothetical protein